MFSINAQPAAIYAVCPRRYLLEVVEKTPRPIRAGEVYESCLNACFRVLINKPTMPIAEISGVFDSMIHERAVEIQEWGTHATISDYLRDGKAFLSHFLVSELPSLKVEKMDEIYHCILIPDESRGVEISSTIPIAEQTHIGFFKLVDVFLSRRELSLHVELTLSALAAGYTQAWILFMKRRVVEVRRCPVKFAKTKLEWMRDYAFIIAEQISKGNFPPCSPQHVDCSAYNCVQWKNCRGAGK
jgi:hypothetical protein